MAPSTSGLKVAFLDRDGTLIFEPPDTRQIDLIEKVKMLPGVVEGLRRLQEEGYRFVMISNQDGRGTASFPEADFQKPQKKFLELLKKEGIEFYRILICPHFADDNCDCRKPRTGLVQDFLKREKLDLDRSIMIGDRPADMEFAKNVGVWGVRMPTNGSFPRLATIERKTRETDVFVQCNLDGTGHYQIQTQLKFLNHMLEQFAKHAFIDLKIKAKGDSEIDEHHTVEDVGLTLGQAISRALGSRKGISRYGFLLPMDDTLAEVALDLGGRPYLAFNCEFRREKVGDLSTEMVEHFFRSLSDSLRGNIHINVRYSRNEHHKIEAIFKACGRALRMACERDPRLEDSLPSTKGVI
ncbi:MAG: bifunctional histidinol-phosphatase/imidazoleglycerol-phosphate dehydratase HisB [Proteobacteria bacterium]|nr:bifunctional histidinol-phosphatase/imidazoleglycerol-phosphate dehydratase HisB [Pseudomonadota bacterium]